MSVTRVEWIEVPCALCGKIRVVEPTVYRKLLKRNQGGLIYCSKSCATKKTKTGSKWYA